MGIVKKDTSKPCGNEFQNDVISILDDYGYDILDLRYIEDIKQVVVTISGVVLFATETDLSISFEINLVPSDAGNLILILSTHINPKKIHLTDCFVITTNPKGEKIAVFGEDAKEAYYSDLMTEGNKYMKILTSPNIKFYEC